MRTSFLALLLFCLSTTLSYGQSSFAVKGPVLDSVLNVPLHNSTIVILNSKDSTLVTHGRAASDGNFSIGNLKEGKFILIVSYPDYANFNLDAIRQGCSTWHHNASEKRKGHASEGLINTLKNALKNLGRVCTDSAESVFKSG